MPFEGTSIWGRRRGVPAEARRSRRPEAIGTRLSAGEDTGSARRVRGIVDHVRRELGDIGVRVAELGVNDVILPGDMRELINKVVEA